MIHVHTRRAGLIALAALVDDHRNVRQTWGFTQEGARRRLIRKESR